ncbi:phosphopantothenoylcysteine decarboxylase/phosphopantothenate/cysteine ligase [Methanobacterium lacus]|uniref:Coenzyme A biosynthesis bifunctional protein CoaBC n=1 Tax=Methanobacterium lacus (strain AL-21) TaxID=877455 RepID=F0T8L4_METLA|nr:bifunctional phosphopantothenoylcysteine decarboxylase/phosphopantothenate--cysteine ligase CoaBC [Methanobacterium lacus]ADZ08556.1 phosphopantothenoylcysteine decarboxylase/phosphopantothenate/cysteine ligase [Methanobacterium lacus]
MEIVLCVTGSIAATECVKLARELKRQGFDVKCFMSEDACNIIHPNAMEFATGQKVVTELTGDIEHVKYAQTDLILVAPATANIISKFAYKMADNPISTLLITGFGYQTPTVFVPSMHESMYRAVSQNIDGLKEEGILFLEPKREEGKAKFPDINDIVLQALRETSEGKLRGKKVLISAGGTYEAIDSVRGITNMSSGKMGLEIAREAFIQGADVTMVNGRVDVPIPSLFERFDVTSASEMINKLTDLLPENDIFISAAAVSDFKLECSDSQKISSDDDLIIHFKPGPKILNMVKELNPNIFLVGFKAESNISEEELVISARKQIEKSGADFVVANDISIEGSGFGSEKNQVVIVDDDTSSVPLCSKQEVAKKIVEKIIERV